MEPGHTWVVDVFVETDRLVLRRFTRDDLELIVELDGDPEVKRYIDNGAPVDRTELAEMLEWWLGWYDRCAGYGFWAAIDKSTGDFLGWFHLRPGDGAGPLEPELGYRLRREAWGQGYATEGSRALSTRRSPSSASPGLRHDDGGQHGVAQGDGEGRAALCAHVRRRLAGQDPRRRRR